MSYDYASVSLFSTFLAGGLHGRMQKRKHEKIARSRYKSGVTLLREDDDFLHSHHAAGFWSLLPYYVGQQTEASCSLASALMVLNATRRLYRLPVHDEALTEDNFFNYVRNKRWQRETRDDGRGVTLAEFSDFLRHAFTALGIEGAEVEAVHGNNMPTDLLLSKLRRALKDAESGQRSFVVANIDLASFVDGFDVGHLSPLGAYDEARGKVLILDVARDELEPYWVDDRELLRSMTSIDAESGVSRGYVQVRLPERKNPLRFS